MTNKSKPEDAGRDEESTPGVAGTSAERRWGCREGRVETNGASPGGPNTGWSRTPLLSKASPPIRSYLAGRTWSPLESLRVGGSKVGGNRGILMASFRQEWGGTFPLCGKKGRLSFLWQWNPAELCGISNDLHGRSLGGVWDRDLTPSAAFIYLNQGSGTDSWDKHGSFPSCLGIRH